MEILQTAPCALNLNGSLSWIFKLYFNNMPFIYRNLFLSLLSVLSAMMGAVTFFGKVIFKKIKVLVTAIPGADRRHSGGFKLFLVTLNIDREGSVFVCVKIKCLQIKRQLAKSTGDMSTFGFSRLFFSVLFQKSWLAWSNPGPFPFHCFWFHCPHIHLVEFSTGREMLIFNCS